MAFVATGGQKQVIRSSLGLSSLGDLQQRELQAVQRYAMAQQQQTERSQPHRFAVSEDTKAATHDFLSLYDKGSRQVENGASVGLSSPSLTTHDFLQPLERNGARSAYRESGHAAREKLNARPDSSTQSRHSTPVQGERVLPAALPNYTSVQVPYAVPPNSTIRLGGEAEALHRQGRGYPVATLSSREDTGGPDSVRGLGAGVDPESGNARDHLAYWPGGRFKFGLPSDLTFPGASPVSRSAVEIGHQSIPALAKQWAQAAQGMVEVPKQAARPPSEDEDEDEDSSERPKGDRKAAATTHRGDTAQRTDAKNSDMRGGTPRSKHSATEQRRRSKINDRFQMLRDLVPHSDQKRDKASFLLEVIDYIQALQEKVRKFETAEQARNQERLKSMVWDLCKRGAGGSGDETSQVNALVFAKDLNSGVGPVDMKPVAGANGEVHAPHACEQAAPVSEAQSTGGFNAQQGLSRPACSIHSCVSSLDGEKENGTALTAQPLAMGMTGQAIPLPYALPIVASKVLRDQDEGRGATSLDPGYGRTISPDHQFEVRPRLSSATQGDQTSGQQSKAEGGVSGAAFTGRVLDGAQAGLASNVSGSRPPHEAPECRSDDMSKHARHAQSHQNEESGRGDGCGASPSSAQAFPRIQGGIINVSSVYSQGLLDTLTRALQSSGVDLSRANISVQIDLGKNATVAAADTSAKVATTPESSAQSHQSQGRTRPPATAAEAEPSLKRPKLETQE